VLSLSKSPKNKLLLAVGVRIKFFRQKQKAQRLKIETNLFKMSKTKIVSMEN
jgi:hypothetical protein